MRVVSAAENLRVYRFANGVRQTVLVALATSAAKCLREQVWYQAATVVKSVPRLESWIRSL
jgi:hypothetical protein